MGELMKLERVKQLLANVNVKERFESILGKKAPQFISSIVNLVSGSPTLQNCEPHSIMRAAFVAASFDLPIDQNLGFAAIVPYKGNAQFQMMYRGFIQLAIRTGQYRAMNASKVFEDELISYNPITKEVKFVTEFTNLTQRKNNEVDKIAGYYAWFELGTGFKQHLYMAVDEIKTHAKTYSKSYQYDLSQGKRSSKWTTDFEPMAIKTVIKLLLSKWGILSIDMQRAITEDQMVYEEGKRAYSDNPDVVDTVVSDPFAEQKEITDSTGLSNKEKEEIKKEEKEQ